MSPLCQEVQSLWASAIERTKATLGRQLGRCKRCRALSSAASRRGCTAGWRPPTTRLRSRSHSS